MAGEDLLEGDDGGSNDSSAKGKKGKKPLSKGQKIGLGIGLATIVLVIYQIKKGSASSAAAGTTTAAAATDPATGYPSGSIQDQQALASMNGTSSANGGSSGAYGGYGSYGSSSTGGGYNTDPAVTSALNTLTSDVQGISTNLTQGGGSQVPTTSTTNYNTTGSNNYTGATTTTNNYQPPAPFISPGPVITSPAVTSAISTHATSYSPTPPPNLASGPVTRKGGGGTLVHGL